MPKLQDAFSNITITLPSYEGSEVVIKSSPNVDDILAAEKTQGDVARSVVLAARMITSWNFTDESDKPLPITEDNIKMLPAQDLEKIFSEIQPLIEKKTV